MDKKWEEQLAEGVEKMATTDDDQRQEKLQAIFSNSLVGEEIVSYLSFGDMQAASEASRHFLNMIRNSRRFNENAVLLVKEKSVESEEFFEETQHNWRCVQIDVNLPVEKLETFSHLFETVEFVSLVLPRLSTPQEQSVVKLLSCLLSCTPNLRQLRIEARLLEFPFKDVFVCAEVLQNLRNLKHLDILKWDEERSAFGCPNDQLSIGGVTYLGPDKKADEETAVVITENFKQLTALPMRLESFRLCKVKMWGESSLAFIPEILRNNRETLEELSVHLEVWKGTEMGELKLPRLKQLSATINSEDQETLAVFLTSHPFLEKLDVGVKKEFSRHLLEVIKGRCGRLRKLHLKANKFSGFGKEEKVEWNWLGKMENLKDFQIAKSSDSLGCIDRYGTGPQFLLSLPKNQLESLSFKGISTFGFTNEIDGISLSPGFDRNSLQGFWTGSDRIEPHVAFMTDFLQGFRNLKRLSFFRCPKAVNCTVMQFVLREFHSLEELEVSHCKGLFDAGIIGTLEGEGGVSLQNLKALRMLSIRKCDVSPEGLLSCLSLPNLRTLHYTPNFEYSVKMQFVEKILDQNPSLEEIGVACWALWNPEEKEKLKKANPRLKRIFLLSESALKKAAASDFDAEEPVEYSDSDSESESESESESDRNNVSDSDSVSDSSLDDN